MDDQDDKFIRRFDMAHLLKQTRLPMITIYKHPTDYPEQYVARVWDVNKPTRLVATAGSLEEVRQAIPEEMYNMGRQNDDDPCIVEVWI